METLRRAKVTAAQTASVDKDFFHHDAGVHHPDFQRMVAGLRQIVRRTDIARVVADRLLPVAVAILRGKILRHDGKHLRFLIIEGHADTQAVGRVEIERWRDDKVSG